MAHPYALRTPWYVLARSGLDRFDPEAQRPAIQKYVTNDFVDRLVTDPRDSVAFDPLDDVWSYPVPVGAFPLPGTGRERFATHRLVRTPMCKLYQPSHDRFYAVTVELFCDEPGLPLPGDLDGINVHFVIRRERTIVPETISKPDRDELWALARKVLLAYDAGSPVPGATGDDDLHDVLWSGPDVRGEFEDEYAVLVERIGAARVVEAWTVDAGGRGRWEPVGADEPPELVADEVELPMWRVPAGAADCELAQARSLWFGLVPTFSAGVDAGGRPRFDNEAVYRIRCFARKPPGPGREHCPPRIWWSASSSPYRLAGFFDPSGTKNRRVSVTGPDLRALAARAGEPAGPGGMEIVQPPGSQLTFRPLDGIPEDGSVGGGSTSRCTFAIELFTIVAMFLFNLFLPIVVFIFRLWWLLALRFCFPRPKDVFSLLSDFFTNGGDLASMPADLRNQFDDLLDAPGAAEKLASISPFNHDPDLGNALLDAVDPANADVPSPSVAEPKPDDPLCPLRLP